MRPRYKPPVKKRFFHTKRKQDKRDIASTKKKLKSIEDKHLRRRLEEKERKRLWR